MLQQTRVETVISYWLKWMQRYLYPIFVSKTYLNKRISPWAWCLHNHVYAFLFHNYFRFPTLQSLAEAWSVYLPYLLLSTSGAYLLFVLSIASVQDPKAVFLLYLIDPLNNLDTIWIQASFDDVNTLWAGRALASDPHISISNPNYPPPPPPSP